MEKGNVMPHRSSREHFERIHCAISQTLRRYKKMHYLNAVRNVSGEWLSVLPCNNVGKNLNANFKICSSEEGKVMIN